MGLLDGKVALITGAARGMGRSHALRFAKEGADIIAVDIAAPIRSASAPATDPSELESLAKEIEALDRRVFTAKLDIRDEATFTQVVKDGVAELGRLDIAIANAGIGAPGHPVEEVPLQEWEDLISINLTGVFLTAKVAIPHIKATGEGSGRLILISSALGLRAMPNVSSYVAAKHGVVGLMKSLAMELAPFNITVNSVHPTNVNTPLIQNENVYKSFRPDLEHPTKEDAEPVFTSLNLLEVPWVEPEDVTEVCLYLAAKSGRFVTGSTFRVDAGWNTK
jgi:SDR family mycofactocin-dependent oxidoreductase